MIDDDDDEMPEETGRKPQRNHRVIPAYCLTALNTGGAVGMATGAGSGSRFAFLACVGWQSPAGGIVVVCAFQGSGYGHPSMAMKYPCVSPEFAQPEPASAVCVLPGVVYVGPSREMIAPVGVYCGRIATLAGGR